MLSKNGVPGNGSSITARPSSTVTVSPASRKRIDRLRRLPQVDQDGGRIDFAGVEVRAADDESQHTVRRNRIDDFVNHFRAWLS